VRREVPALVVVHELGTNQVVAQFRWAPDEGVSLDVFVDEWGRIARDQYERGVSSDAQRRMVPREEGEAFMRALLEPRQRSYLTWIRISTYTLYAPPVNGMTRSLGLDLRTT
jgi:hypothetical protein